MVELLIVVGIVALIIFVARRKGTKKSVAPVGDGGGSSGGDSRDNPSNTDSYQQIR